MNRPFPQFAAFLAVHARQHYQGIFRLFEVVYKRLEVGAVPLRAGPIAAWVAGFVSYQWLSPTGPQWWVEQVERLDPPAWGIGATLPSFAVSFALALAVAITTRRVPPSTVRA